MTKSWSAWFTTNTNMEPGITYLWGDFPFLQSLSVIYSCNTSVLLPAAICNTNIIDIDKYWEIRWCWKRSNRFMDDGCLTNFAQLFRRWMGGWQRCQYFEGKLREKTNKRKTIHFRPRRFLGLAARTWRAWPLYQVLFSLTSSATTRSRCKKTPKYIFRFLKGSTWKYVKYA